MSLVSVIIPTNKRKFEYLKRAIDSVISQTYKNIELIIVDDNNYDEYRKEISINLKKYQNKYTNFLYIKHGKNKGACASRNTGIINSKGVYIAFLDDDDEWDKNKINEQIKKFTSKNIGLVYCDFYTVTYNEKGKEIKTLIKRNKTNNSLREILKFNIIGSTSFPLIRRECFENCGMFDEDILAMQDYDLWIRIAMKYDFESVQMPLANYYVHNSDRISSHNNYKIIALERIIFKYKTYFEKDKDAYSLKCLRLAFYNVVERKYKVAFKNYIKAISLRPFNIKNIVSYLFYGSRVFIKYFIDGIK